jgi:hypothetical protein
MIRLIVICTLAGCSLAVSGPGPKPYRSPVRCTDSHALPKLDISTGVPLALAGAFFLYVGLQGDVDLDRDEYRRVNIGAGIAASILSAAYFTAGIRGGVLVNRCRQAKASQNQ